MLYVTNAIYYYYVRVLNFKWVSSLILLYYTK